MKISQKGLDLIKEFEGCKLTAYYDSVHVLTIGYGTTNADKDIIGTTIVPGMTITQKQADEWLEKSVNNKYVPKVMKYDAIYHWNQNELDSLTSFAYNIGSIDQLTANGTRNRAQISAKILSYDKAGGKVLEGLTRRRKAEKALFDTPYTQQYNEGWIKNDVGKWWYQYKDGSYAVGWKEIEGQWYYFDADGYMANDEFVKSSDYDTNKKLYWVSTDGAWNGKTYYWKQDTIGWWITDGKGYYPKSMWHKIDGKWYYFNEKGYMVTGTKTINGRIYSFRADGTLVE